MPSRVTQIIPRIAVPLLAALVIWQGVIPAMRTFTSDFPNYYAASRMLTDGDDLSRLYDNAWFSAQTEAMGLGVGRTFIPFPPPTVFLLLPLAWLPPLMALQCWTVVNLVVLMLIIVLLSSITKRDLWWCAALVLASGHALINNITLGQMYLVLLLAVLIIYRGMQRDRAIAAGVALGAGAAVKYFPAVYLIPLVVRRQWRIIAWGVVSFAVIVGGAYLAVGRAANMDFLNRIVLSHVGGDIPGQAHYHVMFNSWHSLLRRFFIDDAGAPPAPIVNWPAGFTVGIACAFMAVGATTWYAWTRAKQDGERRLAARFSVLTLAALTLLPAGATYHILLLIPPVALLLAPRGKWSLAQWILLIGYLAIAFMPYGFFFQFDGRGWLTLLAYPRLWALCVMFGAGVVEGTGNEE